LALSFISIRSSRELILRRCSENEAYADLLFALSFVLIHSSTTLRRNKKSRKTPSLRAFFRASARQKPVDSICISFIAYLNGWLLSPAFQAWCFAFDAAHVVAADFFGMGAWHGMRVF